MSSSLLSIEAPLKARCPHRGGRGRAHIYCIFGSFYPPAPARQAQGGGRPGSGRYWTGSSPTSFGPVIGFEGFFFVFVFVFVYAPTCTTTGCAADGSVAGGGPN